MGQAMNCSSMSPDGCAPAFAPVHAAAGQRNPSLRASAETSSPSSSVIIQNEADASTSLRAFSSGFAEPFHFEGRQMLVSASIGIALSSTGNTPEELLHNADTAMYHAKTNGKARFEFFNEGLREAGIDPL
jgi:hypothetical protein